MIAIYITRDGLVSHEYLAGCKYKLTRALRPNPNCASEAIEAIGGIYNSPPPSREYELTGQVRNSIFIYEEK